MTATLSFVVPGPPRGQGRPRFASKGRGGRPLPFVRTYTAKKDVDYAQLVKLHAVAARPEGWVPLTGPVQIFVRIVQKMPGPATWRREQKKGHWSIKKPDASNVLKIVEDALTGIAYVDDRQIAYAMVTKRVGSQGESPYVEVSVKPMIE